jgi:micrococcal nuclease
MRPYFILLFFALASSLQCAPESKGIRAHVVNLADGDSFSVRVNGKIVKVRIYAIDAPEKGMPFYKVSKEYLAKLCGNQTVTLHLVQKDRYGRWVSRVTLPDGRDAASVMIKNGLAWHYKHYSNDPKLAALEKAARQKRIGLWRDSKPTPPWKMREIRRQR